MSVSYSITENIPVSGHVYKFLVKRIGKNVYEASRNDLIGNIVLSSLGKHNDIRISSSKVKLNKVFSVVISEQNYLRSGVNVGIKSGQVFNRMIDLMFREELFYHVCLHSTSDEDKCLQNIRDFLGIYSINEDDIKLETVYRDFKRRKKNQKPVKNNDVQFAQQRKLSL